MTPLLGDMSRDREDTLRKRTADILEREFDELYCSSRLPTAFRRQKKAIVERCYQHVFLHTIRNALPKDPVTQAQLSSLVKQELSSLHTDGTSCSLIGSTEGIATKAPALSHMPEPEHFNITKRHGTALFNESAATQYLYSHQINMSMTQRCRLSRSFMAQHIVRVFLLGEVTYEMVHVTPSSLPEPTVQSACRLAEKLPFSESSPIDPCSSDGSTSVSLFSQALDQATTKEMRVCWPCLPVESAVAGLNSPIRSQHASPIEAERSSVMSSCSSIVPAKRPSPLYTHDNDSSKITKQLRLDNPDVQKTGNDPLLPTLKPAAAISDNKTRSGAGAMSNTRDIATAERIEPPDSTAISMSPSIYSRRSSSVDETLPPREAYTNLVGQNPFRIVSQPKVGKIFSLPGGRRDSRSQLAMRLRQNPKTGAVLQPFIQRPTETPRQVVYTGNKHGMISQAETTAAATTNFFASQMALDPFSIFRYQCVGGTKYASDAGQLQSAIKRYKLKEVSVNSNRLGSDDPRPAAV
ncbi:hypothetical protein T440DRAFT_512403 [Plenodomus tracheiphilus IPT5]|uniref:Uncharacterized protein n=1 Tax=Plenodomus tracheiphilus IPT5 TaxID=1408161 RepID=A0A6A7APF2_9PLEO|nr:hypothetical protein T440DRAFT_512403 [Plenodomus tracheiphilus IPT5]